MSIQIAINHKTEYRFDRAVNLSPHVVRLRPAPHSRTPILSYSLRIEPKTHFINWQQDPFGNYLARLVFPEKADAPLRRGRSDRRDDDHQPVRLLPGGVRGLLPFAYDAQLTKELGPYLEIKEDGPLLNAWLAQVDRSQDAHRRLPGRAQPAPAKGHRLRHPHGDRASRPARRPWARPWVPAATRPGCWCRSCGTWAWRRASSPATSSSSTADVEVARRPQRARGRLHRPARLGRGLCPGCRLDRAGPHLRPVRRRGAHPAGLHAGPGQRGPDHRAPPTSARSSFYFHNQVTRIHEDPRVTKPYTDEQWEAIEAARPAGRRAIWLPATCA